MSDKTFKTRVCEEAKNFVEIYEFFKNDHSARVDEGLAGNAWLHVFEVPINDGYAPQEQQSFQIRGKQKTFPHKHDVVKKAVQQLKIGELRLGPLIYSDPRIGAALEYGIATPDDLFPPSGEQPKEFEGLVKRGKVNHADPYFWRALVEIFCRALVSTGGRRPWSTSELIEFAFDLMDIRLNYLEDRWDADKALKILRTKQPYASKKNYRSAESAAGLAGIGRDRVNEIEKLMGGPVSSEGLNKLKGLFPDIYFVVAERHYFKNDRTPAEILAYADGIVNGK